MSVMANTDSSCSACGWSLLQQQRCSYMSHVKLFYGAADRGVWALGSDVVLKEQPVTRPQSEVPTILYLKEYTQLPVPSIIANWVDNDNRQFLLTKRIQGTTLQEAWPTLSRSEKESIADQVAEQLVQLRQSQSSRIESIDQGPLYSGFLFLQDINTPHGPFKLDAELADSLQGALTGLSPEVVDKFKARLPKATPYTLTHGDLANCNIIVHNKKLAGILDWEWAGYFPVWWEYVSLSIGLGPEDVEWKGLLRERVAPYPEAKEFWVDFYSLHQHPNLDERGQTLLKELQGGSTQLDFDGMSSCK